MNAFPVPVLMNPILWAMIWASHIVNILALLKLQSLVPEESCMKKNFPIMKQDSIKPDGFIGW